jgi:hypothetical protein
MGRPLKSLLLTPDQIQYLASIGCTNKEIAILAGFKEHTGLEKRFSRILAKGREEGKTRLRKLQWQSAIKGSYVMQIWLGKQLLEQSDKLEHKSIQYSAIADISKISTEKLKQIRDLMLSKEPNGTPGNPKS